MCRDKALSLPIRAEVSLIWPPADGDFGPYWRHLHSIDASELKASMRGPGTVEDSLTEIILRTNLERWEINRVC